jgi:orotidine-5'-phosphate decarboxylase
MTPFAERLAEAVRQKRTPLCLGLDPRWESLPTTLRQRYGTGTLEEHAAAYTEFCTRTIDLLAPLVGVVKPQSAFFEQCGSAGVQALHTVLRHARLAGLVTILDNKRGDISTTATAYADAGFGVADADALTVNPYLGSDAVEPFLTRGRQSGRGVFVLVRTSNPGAGLFQDLRCAGEPVYRHVARAVGQWNAAGPHAAGLGDVGAVVGATYPAELAEIRALLTNVWLLVPGFGAQGGTAADLAGAFRSDGLGALVNSSRGLTFPYHPNEPAWEAAIVTATHQAIAQLQSVCAV